MLLLDFRHIPVKELGKRLSSSLCCRCRKRLRRLHPRQGPSSWWCGDLTQLFWPQVPCSFFITPCCLPIWGSPGAWYECCQNELEQTAENQISVILPNLSASLTQKSLNSNLRKTHRLWKSPSSKRGTSISSFCASDFFKLKLKYSGFKD